MSVEPTSCRPVDNAFTVEVHGRSDPMTRCVVEQLENLRDVGDE